MPFNETLLSSGCLEMGQKEVLLFSDAGSEQPDRPFCVPSAFFTNSMIFPNTL
jgi:hypothetical protein